jgi:hypothetical protein
VFRRHTYLYGRRIYETLAVWETDATLANRSDVMADYASAWQAPDKVVYSSTLASPCTANTRLERHFDPSAAHLPLPHRGIHGSADLHLALGRACRGSVRAYGCRVLASLIGSCDLVLAVRQVDGPISLRLPWFRGLKRS